MKSALLNLLLSGARVTISTRQHGNFPIVLWMGEARLADGDETAERMFAAALEGGTEAASWGVKISAEF